MKGRAAGRGRVFAHALLGVMVFFCGAQASHAQGSGLERTFPQSKARVEKALQEMQAATAGQKWSRLTDHTYMASPSPRHWRRNDLWTDQQASRIRSIQNSGKS